MSTSDMLIGRIGEYRELDHEERQKYLMRLIEAPGNETLAIQQAGAQAIVEMFNEALSCLTDGTDWLVRIDSQYKIECKEPESYFWDEVYEAIKPLKNILLGLEEVAKYMPKGAEPVKEGAS